MAEGDVLFPPFRFDAVAQQLWRGNQPLELRPKTFALLRYLLGRPGQLVTKDDVLQHVWPDIVVGDQVPGVSIRELRRTLEDDRWAPKFIETVHGRGFRWIGSSRQLAADGRAPEEQLPFCTQHSGLRTVLVGRERELATLHGYLERALAGERQLVFVTGEAGIGKTALVDTFVSSLSTLHCRLSTAFGQCIQLHGQSEAYLPVLEALGELGRGAAGPALAEIFRQRAPTWLLHVPSLASGAEREALQRQLAGISTHGVISELVDSLDALTQERPVVLVFEDLHWSDPATVGLLAAIAQRRGAARLLVVGTYRPAEAIVHEHPLAALKLELQRKRLCREVALAGLTEEATHAYLERRFCGSTFSTDLPSRLAAHTAGNPLYLATTLDHLISIGGLAETEGQWKLVAPADSGLGVPESLRELIDCQCAALGTEAVRVLEAASMAGAEFATQAIAAALRVDVEAVDDICAALARHGQFIRALGTIAWPDGTFASRFAFQHALYQSVLYDRLPLARRQRLHRSVGERLESAYAARSGEIAAELAMHFERAGDAPRTLPYLRSVARRSGDRGAYQEAIACLRRALLLINRQPQSPARSRDLLKLQLALADLLLLAEGYGYPEVEEIFGRCLRLSEEVDDRGQQFMALSGLTAFLLWQVRLDDAAALNRRLVSIAEATPLPVATLVAHTLTGVAHLSRGELLMARTHLERALAAKAEQPAFIRPDFKTMAVTCLAFSCALLGYTDQARAHERESLGYVHATGSYYDQTQASMRCADMECTLGDRAAAARLAAQCMALASRYGFSDFVTRAQIVISWARVLDGRTEDLSELDRCVQMLRPAAHDSSTLLLSFFLFLSAQAHAHVGDVPTALERLATASACIAETGERFYEAEVHRLKGEILLTQVDRRPSRVEKPRRRTSAHCLPRDSLQNEAEACFQRALDVARQQDAKLFELRAATSLARLWRAQGKQEAARNLVAPVHGWFTEGLDTPDMAAAKALAVWPDSGSPAIADGCSI